MNGAGKTTQESPSDSDDDLYTKSIDLRKLRATFNDCSRLSDVASSDSIERTESTPSPDIVIIDDEDLKPKNTLTKFKERRERRLKFVEQEIMPGETYLDCEIPLTFMLPLSRKKLPLHQEIIVLDPPTDMVLRNKKVIATPKKNNPETVLLEEANLQECPKDVSDEAAPLTRGQKSLGGDSHEADPITHGKEVDLFVTVRLDPKTLKPGRFMTIRQDERFDSLRPIFAEELKCNKLDVLIHVNDVDAGPGDTPDSMGLDLNKLAVVKVFSLKSHVGLEEDFSTDPSFIPVKCIFEKGRPRCAYINLTESIYDAKNRIRAQLKLIGTISKLIFDNEVISDEETPQSMGIEADDIIEVHFSL